MAGGAFSQRFLAHLLPGFEAVAAGGAHIFIDRHIRKYPAIQFDLSDCSETACFQPNNDYSLITLYKPHFSTLPS